MRVLVVGGAGYIGSVCARALALEGHEVVTLDDLSTGHRDAVSGALVVGDVRERDALNSVFAVLGPFDAVLHFAARSLVGESVRDPLGTLDLNVRGTLALLAAMRDYGCRCLVFSSSCAVYGTPERMPVDEGAPFAPTSPYGLSKALVEGVLDAVRGPDLRIASLRYFNAAGAWDDLGERHANETHLIPLAIAAALGSGPPLTVFGDDWPTEDGTCLRDYVHVCDLAQAHRQALDRLLGGDTGRAWNLGCGVPASVRTVLREVERATGRSVQVVVGPRRAGDPTGLWADATRARLDLGWVPRFDLRACVEDAVRFAR